LVIDAICARNKNRKSLTNISENGLHYSWDWNGVHFINLGIVVGEGKAVNQKRRYSPMNSLEFLISDLKSKVSDTGKPVVITHHVDMIRYVVDTPNSTTLAKEWDATDVKAFYAALKGYKIAAINYGHTHVRNIFRWAGGPKVTASEEPAIPVFNTDNASHFNSKQQAFLHFTLTDMETTVREFGTTDSWQTGTWKDQMWKFPI
jgi:cytolysin (calcineurin-like family phosphatase)